MITPSRGNLLTADAEALVNTVNTEGAMGKGIALQFARAFPEIIPPYEAACRSGKLRPGKVQIIERPGLINPRWIVNFPTKRHWRGKSRLADIDAGLVDLVHEVRTRGIRSIAIPPLGCGLGGLDWAEVEPRIRAAFVNLPDVKVLLFAPEGAPTAAAQPSRTLRPALNPARARVIEVLAAYLALGYELSLLEVQKLLYFLQVAGDELKLDYVKHRYGPYADNLRHVLKRFEGHFTQGFGDGVDAPDTRIELLPDAHVAAASFLAEARAGAGADDRLARVVTLIEGFESPYGLELLATVHWVATHEDATTLDATVDRIHTWSDSKRQRMSREHIALAWDRLRELGWLPSPLLPASESTADDVAGIPAQGRGITRKYEDLTHEQLVRLLRRRDAERQLGLVWERDDLDPDKALNDDYVALTLDSALSHGEAPWENLIIEGDNYDALRALKMSHKGAVHCIYIDPPYNTGNRDFVYNDRFIDKTHRFRHSLWLEFVYQRLLLAKELLAPNGIIFVSIDDNEVFRLGMLMDLVFSTDNWVQTLIWKKAYGGGAKTKHVIGLHEYVLLYAKDKSQLDRIELPPDPEAAKYYKFKDSKFNVRGPYRLQPLATNSMDSRPNLRYAIPHQGREIWPEKQWQWQESRALEALVNDELVFTPRGDSWTVSYKQYLNDEQGSPRGSKPKSILDGPFTQEGTSEIKEIFGDGKTFSFPKPSNLLRQLLSYVPNDALILDFFAGSGTTAHAVARLNSDDGGTRRFILVSSTEATEDQPEKNICRDVCAERVRRVQGGYTNAKGEAIAGKGGGFAYLRARRIPPHRLASRIEHAEVWNALELMHSLPLSPWSGCGFQGTATKTRGVAYISDGGAEATKALKSWVETQVRIPMRIYSWTPERLRALAPDADWAPIPESLRLRFGQQGRA